MFKKGDRVRIKPRFYNSAREIYPFLPDVAGQEGTVSRLVTEIASRTLDKDEIVYVIRFDTPFKQGVIPEGQSSFDYIPKKWKKRKTLWLTSYHIKKC